MRAALPGRFRRSPLAPVAILVALTMLGCARSQPAPTRPRLAGRADPEGVAATIRSAPVAGAVRACYDEARRKARKGRKKIKEEPLRGKLELRFLVDGGGKVSDVLIESNMINEPVLTRCVVDAALQWRFPPPTGGPAEFTWAFAF